MFKKVLQSLTKAFGAKITAPPVNRASSTARSGDSDTGKKGLPESDAVKSDAPPKAPSPESLCGITVKMPKYEIRKRLAVLYRRYNRAASSLDAGMRAESEMMLDAIVKVREKHFDPI